MSKTTIGCKIARQVLLSELTLAVTHCLFRCCTIQVVMKIVIGSDHAGVELKRNLMDFLEHQGHEVVNVGSDSLEPVDYPDYAEKVGDGVLDGVGERGILICGSGVGASVAVNKL